MSAIQQLMASFGGSNIMDSYDETNSSNPVDIAASPASFQGYGQSFTGDGGAAVTLSVYATKIGAPTGNVVAKIYAHSGTFGTSSVPTGAALATSTAIDITTISTGAFRLIDFTFTSPPTLTNGTKYFVSVEFSGGNGTNYFYLGTDNTSPTHGGNAASYNGTSWSAISGTDMCFYVRK